MHYSGTCFGKGGRKAQGEAQKTSALRRVLEERQQPVLKTQSSQRQSCRDDACKNGCGSGDGPTRECWESTDSPEKRSNDHAVQQNEKKEASRAKQTIGGNQARIRAVPIRD